MWQKLLDRVPLRVQGFLLGVGLMLVWLWLFPGYRFETLKRGPLDYLYKINVRTGEIEEIAEAGKPINEKIIYLEEELKKSEDRLLKVYRVLAEKPRDLLAEADLVKEATEYMRFR